MQQAKTLAASALAQPSTTCAPPSPPEKLRQGLLDNLWLKMTEMYGRRWTGSFGVSADQSHAWAATLGGLTKEQMGIGLTALALTRDPQLRKWPPSAPEFRALCENGAPEDNGLPSPGQAYREAVRNAHPAMAGRAEWSCDAVYHAVKETGFYELNNLQAEASRRLFERNYALAVRDFLAGKPLAAMPKALPETAASTRTEAVGREALRQLRATVREGSANG